MREIQFNFHTNGLAIKEIIPYQSQAGPNVYQMEIFLAKEEALKLADEIRQRFTKEEENVC